MHAKVGRASGVMRAQKRLKMVNASSKEVKAPDGMGTKRDAQKKYPLKIEIGAANGSNPCTMTPMTDVAYDFYLNQMFSDHSTEGQTANHMYDLVKEYDTLDRKNMGLWGRFGYTMPEYTANVPPTYKKTYGSEEAAQNGYKFQTIVERGSDLMPHGRFPVQFSSQGTVQFAEDWQPGQLAQLEDFKTSEGMAYQHIRKLKKCEFDTGCIDYGWLDRLMYKTSGKTRVLQHRTLKMHPKFSAGDHSPLFMLLESQ